MCVRSVIVFGSRRSGADNWTTLAQCGAKQTLRATYSCATILYSSSSSVTPPGLTLYYWQVRAARQGPRGPTTSATRRAWLCDRANNSNEQQQQTAYILFLVAEPGFPHPGVRLNTRLNTCVCVSVCVCVGVSYTPLLLALLFVCTTRWRHRCKKWCLRCRG